MNSLKQNQKGFTIVELMIATTVLSVILLLSTVAMVNIGRLYYKGVNQARVQDTVRSINDEISQNLQSSGANPKLSLMSKKGKIRAYCIGDVRYTYVLNTQIGTGEDQAGKPKSNHVLWRDKAPSNCPKPSNNFLDNPTNGVELMPANSRLIDFKVDKTSPFEISIAIVYGDNDLYKVSSTPLGKRANCKGGVGGQFCASAALHTIVTRRLTE